VNQVGDVVHNGNPSIPFTHITANGTQAPAGPETGAEARIVAADELSEAGRDVADGDKTTPEMAGALTGIGNITATSDAAHVNEVAELTRSALKGFGFNPADIDTDAELFALMNNNPNLREAVGRVFTAATAAGANRIELNGSEVTTAEKERMEALAREQNAAPVPTPVPAAPDALTAARGRVTAATGAMASYAALNETTLASPADQARVIDQLREMGYNIPEGANASSAEVMAAVAEVEANLGISVANGANGEIGAKVAAALADEATRTALKAAHDVQHPPTPAVQPIAVNATGNPAAAEVLTDATLNGARATVGDLATQVQTVTGIAGEAGFGAKTEQAVIIAAQATGNAALIALVADGDVSKADLQTLFNGTNTAQMLQALQAVKDVASTSGFNLGDNAVQASEIAATTARVATLRNPGTGQSV